MLDDEKEGDWKLLVHQLWMNLSGEDKCERPSLDHECWEWKKEASQEWVRCRDIFFSKDSFIFSVDNFKFNCDRL